jgi:EAL domain-containing protein (putative c-di-GMP-specific phosphodiesterase class I)
MIIAISHEMGFSTVAEGIETEMQLEAVRRLGCDAVQGYLIARPMPKREIGEFMASTRLAAAAGE